MNKRQIKKRLGKSQSAVNSELDTAKKKLLMQVYTQAIQGVNNSPWSTLYKNQDRRDSHEIAYDIASLRERSKMFYLNDPIYRPLIDNLAKNIIGTGFVYKSEDLDSEDKFYEYTKSPTECGKSWEDFLYTVVRYFFIYGDVLLLKRNDKIVIIDPQRIHYSGESYGENPVIDGVEIDDLTSRPIAFHVSTQSEKSIRIPAEETIYITNSQIPGEIRGEPSLSQIADLLEYSYQYTTAAVLAARISASLSLVVTSSDIAGFSDYLSGQLDLTTPSLTYMPAGSSIQQIKSENPMGNYDTFNSSILNQICTCMGLTPAALGNVEKLNFSSSKLSIEVARDTYRRWQRFFRDYLIHKLWDWKNEGIEVEIRGSGFKSYDIANDYAAEALAIETGLESLSSVLANRGIWLDEHLEKLKEEQLKLKGIKLNHSQMTQKNNEEITDA